MSSFRGHTLVVRTEPVGIVHSSGLGGIQTFCFCCGGACAPYCITTSCSENEWFITE